MGMLEGEGGEFEVMLGTLVLDAWLNICSCEFEYGQHGENLCHHYIAKPNLSFALLSLPYHHEVK